MRSVLASQGRGNIQGDQSRTNNQIPNVNRDSLPGFTAEVEFLDDPPVRPQNGEIHLGEKTVKANAYYKTIQRTARMWFGAPDPAARLNIQRAYEADVLRRELLLDRSVVTSETKYEYYIVRSGSFDRPTINRLWDRAMAVYSASSTGTGHGRGGGTR